MGDFVIIDRSNPESVVGWIVELKRGGRTAGNQLTNAQNAADAFRLARHQAVAGTADELLEILSVGRGSWGP